MSRRLPNLGPLLIRELTVYGSLLNKTQWRGSRSCASYPRRFFGTVPATLVTHVNAVYCMTCESSVEVAEQRPE